MKTIKLLLLLAVLGVGVAASVMYSGVVDVSADKPHGVFVYWVLEKTRENSIASASKDIKVPDLSDAELLLSGGTDYEFMCAGCHLKPGQIESDLSVGLYPAPPNLSVIHDEEHSKNARNFWVIKHGIKASGMPAWGKTHDDERIWAMVAFIERLPALTPEQYQILTAID